MQRWEYCHVENRRIIFYTLEGYREETYRNPGQGSYEDSYKVLARLGREGWEAYAIIDTWHYLKRPLREAKA